MQGWVPQGTQVNAIKSVKNRSYSAEFTQKPGKHGLRGYKTEFPEFARYKKYDLKTSSLSSYFLVNFNK